MTIKQIIAAGGDAMSDQLFHLYTFAQCKKANPKICLLPTPAADDKGLIRYFLHNFHQYDCQSDYLTFFENKEPDIEDFLLSQDIIIVAGGHSKAAVGVWKEFGVDKILHRAYENGTIMTGGSAGAVCWAQEAISDSYFGELRPVKFMNFLPFSICPHYVSDERRKVYKAAILAGEIGPGYGINDGAFIHFVDGKPFRSIATSFGASTFYVEALKNLKKPLIQSTRLKTPWLGAKEIQNDLIWNSEPFKALIAKEAEEEKALNSPEPPMFGV